MDCKELIVNNRLQEAINILKEETKGSYFEKEIMLLESSLTNLKTQENLSMSSFDNDNIANNRFKNNFLNVLEEWENEKNFTPTEGTKITFLQGKSAPLEKDIALILEVVGKGNVLEAVKYHFRKNPMVSFIHVTALKTELDNETTDDFESFIIDFKRLLTWLRTAPKKVKGKQPLLHIFLAIPVALALGCGANFRNLFPFQVYNYDRTAMKYTLNIRSKEVLGQ